MERFSYGGGEASGSGREAVVARARAAARTLGNESAPEPQRLIAEPISLDAAATKLTDRILGYSAANLVDILKQIAVEYGLKHICHMGLDIGKSSDTNVLTAVVTYEKEWQARYFLKGYFAVDPVTERGRESLLPFDWDDLALEKPDAAEFFEDAFAHGVGRYGLTFPVRNRRSMSIVTFTSDAGRDEWEMFKRLNMPRLQQLAALIDSAAAATTSNKPPPKAQLSRREEQCLIWAARGKTHQEVADILVLSPSSVRSHLDTARHKLHCINLTHTVGVAVATGVIPASALRDSP